MYVTEKEIEDEDKKVLLSIILLRNFSFDAAALLLHNFFFSTVTLMASFNAVASIVSIPTHYPKHKLVRIQTSKSTSFYQRSNLSFKIQGFPLSHFKYTTIYTPP
jgi:hypothetical protein